MIEISGNALYQWDTGRYVTVTDITADHVHFSNKGDSKAVIMELSGSQAKIPDYLFQTGKQICVYVVRDGITVESKVFFVTKREKPEDYIYEEDQRNFVYELIKSAEAATEAANHAAEAATQATQSADGAANRANAAAESAENTLADATEAATAATLKAENAATIANTATETATAATLKAENAATIANTATETANQAAESANDAASVATESGERANKAAAAAENIVKELQNGNYARIDNTAVGTDAWSSKNIVDKLCPSFTESGTVVTCEPVEGYPLEVVSKIEPIQSGSGDPSPDNIRPIAGFDSVKLWWGGKNLLGYTDFSVAAKNRTLSWSNGVGKISFANNVYTGWLFTAETNSFLKNNTLLPGTYVFSIKQLNGTALTGVYAEVLLDDESTVQLLDGKSLTLTQNGTISGIKCDSKNFSAGEEITFTLQIEVGEVATEHEPYRGEEFTLDLGQTVYGGSLDWKTGVLTLDRVKVVLSGDFGADGNQFYTMISPVANDAVTKYNCICSHYPGVTRNQLYSNRDTDGYIGCSANSGYMRVVDNARFKGDVNAFNAWLAENNIEVVYRLATPISIGYFDPQENLALSGVNTLYSNTGDTTVTGRADTTAVIQDLYNKLNALSATMTALTGV